MIKPFFCYLGFAKLLFQLVFARSCPKCPQLGKPTSFTMMALIQTKLTKKKTNIKQKQTFASVIL